MSSEIVGHFDQSSMWLAQHISELIRSRRWKSPRKWLFSMRPIAYALAKLLMIDCRPIGFITKLKRYHQCKVPVTIRKYGVKNLNDTYNSKFIYNDVIMSTIASQITSLTIVYSTVYSGADQRKHQSSASLAFVWGIQRGPVNSPHKGPVTRKMFPFDDIIIFLYDQHFGASFKVL